MDYKKFRGKVIDNLIKYKNKNLTDKDGIYRNKPYKHILPKELLKLNYLKMATPLDVKKLHTYAHHLNSSQIMCINFFSPIIENPKLLIDILNIHLPIKNTNKLEVKAKFEYIPDKQKRTNFDFYIKLSSGENIYNIYFEIKYTENGFTSISKPKQDTARYEGAWKDFYKNQTDKSLHLKGITPSEFYGNYQINRNIAYIVNEKDYVCFVYPFDNNSLQQKMNEISFANVLKIDWHALCETAINATIVGSDYQKHYIEFKEKYLDYNS